MHSEAKQCKTLEFGAEKGLLQEQTGTQVLLLSQCSKNLVLGLKLPFSP